jgi:intein-encoded DNA endonuclease-like protein
MIRQRLETNKNYIINAYKNGKSTNTLGKEFKCNCGTIWYFLKDCGIEIKKKSPKYGTCRKNKDEIIRLHKSGESCYSIANKFGVKTTSIVVFLKRQGCDTSKYCTFDKDNLLKDKTDQVIEMYKSGKSTDQIAEELGYAQPSIWKLLEKNGIKCRGSLKYSVNHSFFDIIDNEFNSYILGFLYADGNVDEKHYTFRAFQNIDDADIIHKIRDVIEYNGPIYIREREAPRKTMYTLQVSSEPCVKSLIKHGCLPNKSLVLDWVTTVPDYLLSHFMRGYFDGDGSIGGRSNYVSITSNDKFLFGLKKYVNEKLNIDGQIYYRYQTRTCASLMFTKKLSSEIFLRWIYSGMTDKSLFLKRKFDKYQRVISRT